MALPILGTVLFAFLPGPGARVRARGRHGESRKILPTIFRFVERRRSRHPDSQASQGGVCQAAMNGEWPQAMDPERWKQVDHLLQSVRERPPKERDAFLQKECIGDEALEREVRSLLNWQEQAGSFLEKPAIQVAESS